MKFKYILVIVFAAIVTLSFTFTTSKSRANSSNQVVSFEPSSAPIGGLIADDSF